jgi:hypothetical protein
VRVVFLFVLMTVFCAAAPARADFEYLVLGAFANGPAPDDDDTVTVQRKPNYLRVDTNLTITTGRPGFYEVETRDCTAVVRELVTIDGAPKLEYRIDIRRAVALVDRDGDTFVWKGGAYGSARVLIDGQFREIELRSPAGPTGSSPRRIGVNDAGFLPSAYAHQIKQSHCR